MFCATPICQVIFSNAAAFLLGTVAANHERIVHRTMGLVITWLCATRYSSVAPKVEREYSLCELYKMQKFRQLSRSPGAEGGLEPRSPDAGSSTCQSPVHISWTSRISFESSRWLVNACRNVVCFFRYSRRALFCVTMGRSSVYHLQRLVELSEPSLPQTPQTTFSGPSQESFIMVICIFSVPFRIA